MIYTKLDTRLLKSFGLLLMTFVFILFLITPIDEVETISQTTKEVQPITPVSSLPSTSTSTKTKSILKNSNDSIPIYRRACSLPKEYIENSQAFNHN